MNKFGFLAGFVAAFVAGCGSGDGGKIFGGVVSPAAVIPGAACTNASLLIPTVTSSNPASGAVNVAPGNTVTATFNMAMNPASLNSNPAGTLLTFTLKETTGANVPGTVAMNGANTVATFTTPAPLLISTQYTATITVAATSAAPANTPLGCVVEWSFTTGAVVPLAIDLGSAATFGIAAGAGMTSTGVTVVNGDVALSPTGTCTDATGLPANCAVNPKPASATGLTVNGSIFFAADLFDGGVTAAAVKNDLTTAWNQGRAMVPNQATVAADQLSSVIPYAPGIRNNANLGMAAGGRAILDAAGDANAVWIFQVDTDMTDSGTLLLPSTIELRNGAQARNVWFVVGRDAVIGNGSIWNGNVLAGRDFTVNIGATMMGRALSGAAPGGAGFISLLDGATITVP